MEGQMKILIMGAGALGGYFGARLQAAGHDVVYVARGAHLKAMQNKGLSIESGCGDFHLPRVQATDDPSSHRDVDAVIFMVKNYDVETAADLMAPAINDKTIVVTGQNGVSAPDRLAARLGPEQIFPGAVYMPADVKAPGVIRHPSDFHRIVVGSLSGTWSDTAHAFVDAVRASGPVCETAEDIRAMLWEKFVFLSSLAAMTCITRADAGPVRGTPETAQLLHQAISEAAAVGHAECPTLVPDVAEKVWTFFHEGIGPDVHSSMLDDLNRGKRLELNYLNGDIAARGAKHGIETPVHSFVTAALQMYVDGAPA